MLPVLCSYDVIIAHLQRIVNPQRKRRELCDSPPSARQHPAPSKKTKRWSLCRCRLTTPNSFRAQPLAKRQPNSSLKSATIFPTFLVNCSTNWAPLPTSVIPRRLHTGQE